MSETLQHPPGEVHHWTIATIYSATVPLPPFDEVAEVWVEAEVPRDVDGVAVMKRGNRFYPTSVKVALDESSWLSPEAARALARALLIAADVCASHDVEDTDMCGHWALCACTTRKDTDDPS